MPTMPARLLTLGHFELIVESPAGRRSVPTQVKRLVLLAYLGADSTEGFRRRDAVVELLWPELGPEEARRALRQALYYLRQLLGDNVIVTRADDHLGIGTGLSCDVVEFEQAVAQQRWADALELYRGPFLNRVQVPNAAPEFEEWTKRTRARLQSAASAAAWQLAAEAEKAGDESAAARAAVRAHELAPEDEDGLLRLRALLQRQGDRASAQPRPMRAVEIQPSPAAALGTTALKTSAVRIRRRAVLTVAALAALVTLAGTAYTIATGPTRVAPGLLNSSDLVLVTDLRSPTGDSTLGRVLAEALRVDIAQSPYVRVLTNAQMRGTLRLMKQPVDITVNDSLAREIALREGAKAIVAGDVTADGRKFLVSLRLLSAPDGNLLASVREAARDTTKLIALLDQLSAKLRARMGEALRTIEAEPALDKVTTASLPALRKYADFGYANEVLGDRPAAIRLLEEAVALDSSFASAQRSLGALYSAIAEPGRAARALDRAIAHQDRLPLRERSLTLGSYHRVVTREYEQAAAAYRALLELYPNDIAGLNNLALVYSAQRKLASADSLFSRVIAIDSTIPSVYVGRAGALIGQSRFDSARRVLDGVWARFPNYPQTRLIETYLAAARQDWPTAERHMRLAIAAARGSGVGEGSLLQSLSEIVLLGGRLAEAERQIATGRALAVSSGSPGRYLNLSILSAWLELHYRRRPARALRQIDGALAKYPIESIDPGDRPYVELANFYAAAGLPAHGRALLNSVERDSAAAAALRGASWHQLRGVVALAEGRAREAVTELLQADARMRCSVCVLPSLAQAYQLTGDTRAAIATYERYITTPWIWRFESDAPYMGTVLQQLAELYHREGQPARAAEQYMRLLRLWSAADPELGVTLGEVRARLARVQR